MYTVTIEGTVVGSNSVTAETTYTITLVDPCDPPTSVTAQAQTDQVYTITQDVKADYTLVPFLVSPSYCPLTLTYDI